MMATPQQKAQCVIWLIETKSVVTVQRNFRRNYGVNPPSDKTIRQWFSAFKETGSVLKQKSPGRPSVSQEKVDRIRASCLRSPKKSLTRRSLELGLPRSTVGKVLHKRLRLTAYKIQLVHHIKPADKLKRYDFAVSMLDKIDDNNGFLKSVIFSDEASFHVNGHVNRHNCRIWGSEPPHEFVEYERDTPKVNVWCALMHDRIIGPFIFIERNINGDVYCDMLEEYLFPQLDDIEAEKGLVYFQQDGAPPHFSLRVREALDARLGNRWIGREGPIPWPPRSPDLTPLDFSFWGHIKNLVYAEKIRDVQHLRERIVNCVATVPPDMLARTWEEVEYRLDVCRATNGAHIELY